MQVEGPARAPADEVITRRYSPQSRAQLVERRGNSRWFQHLILAILNMMFYVYIIQSKTTKELYVGFTPDIRKRMFSHNSASNIATKHGVPWELIYVEGYRSERDARTRELKLKHHGNSKRFVKERIKYSLL